MDNQHKLITGYRDLSQDEITRINEWKEIEHHLSRMLNAAVINGTAQARWNAMARS